MLRLIGLLSVVAGLALTGLTGLSWWWALAPIWLPVATYLVVSAALIMLAAFAMGQRPGHG